MHVRRIARNSVIIALKQHLLCTYVLAMWIRQPSSCQGTYTLLSKVTVLLPLHIICISQKLTYISAGHTQLIDRSFLSARVLHCIGAGSAGDRVGVHVS